MEITTLAMHHIPGSASVAVSRSNTTMKMVSNLQQGEEILLMDIAAGNIFIWATLQHIECVRDEAMLQNSIIVGFGADDSVPLKADQVVLAKDRKKKVTVMQKVSRLEVGFHSVIAFKMHDLQTPLLKKINSLEVVRDNVPSECFYKLFVGSTNHSLLVSYAQDANCFVVVNCSNINVDLKGTARLSERQIESKNTFIVVNDELEKEKRIARNEWHGGIPQSYSDTDLHRLAVELNMDEICASPAFIRANVNSLTLASSESRSDQTSSAVKSVVSSISAGEISEVRLGTRSYTAEDGRQKSAGSNQMQWSDFSNLPVNELGVRLSAASINHKSGRKSNCCKCMNYTAFSLKKGKVCKNGALCDFCHGPHDRFIHRR